MFEEKEKQNIYSLDLHEETSIDGHNDIIRVPGGWIYRFHDEQFVTQTVFVPYNNEFMHSVMEG